MVAFRVCETVKARIRTAERVECGVKVRIGADEAHHVLGVLRACVGDEFGLVDGAGRLFRVRLVSTKPCEVEPFEELAVGSVNADRRVEMWIPLLKSKRTDSLVRQLTELGVHSVTVYLSERSVVHPNKEAVAKLLDRYQRISDEATKQCRRTDSVELSFNPALPTTRGGVFLWEKEGVRSDLLRSEPDSPLCLLIGPEGGLSQNEALHLRRLDWQSVWLGDRILRAETAVVAAASLAIYA
jgi:16S rRNA (uracil1498-N3)-methyltransferase